eukprot:364314-Chlamydomonas_euryale.AAC.14
MTGSQRVSQQTPALRTSGRPRELVLTSAQCELGARYSGVAAARLQQQLIQRLQQQHAVPSAWTPDRTPSPTQLQQLLRAASAATGARTWTDLAMLASGPVVVTKPVPRPAPHFCEAKAMLTADLLTRSPVIFTLS